MAENIIDLFRNDRNESQNNDMIIEELNPRASKCDGQFIIRTNQLVLDLISLFAHTCEDKMQNIEISVVKAADLLIQMEKKVAKTGNETKESSEVNDECNDVFGIARSH